LQPRSSHAGLNFVGDGGGGGGGVFGRRGAECHGAGHCGLSQTAMSGPCASPSDCSGESVCTPESLIFPVGPCFTPRCTRDVVCSRGAEGRCALILQDGQFGGRSLQKVGCVYAGDFREATACDPSDAIALRGNSTSPPWPAYYTCPEPSATP